MPTQLLILARAVHYGSGLILAGVVTFRWLVLLPSLRGEAEEAWQSWTLFFRWLNRLFLGSGVMLVVSGFALFWAVAAEMSGASLRESLDGEILRTVLFHTQFGWICLWRLGLAILLGLTAWKLTHDRWIFRPNVSALEIMMSILVAALLALVAGTGHAAARGGVDFFLRVAADGLHLLAASVWPTGLLPFALFLVAARRAENFSNLPPILAVVRRFSAVSFITVGVMVVTGMVNSWFLVGNMGALFTTPYGHILCLKLSLFAGILGFAAWNRFRLLPALFLYTDALADKNVTPLLRRLQNFVLAELVLAVGVIAVVSVLGITPPPR